MMFYTAISKYQMNHFLPAHIAIRDLQINGEEVNDGDEKVQKLNEAISDLKIVEKKRRLDYNNPKNVKYEVDFMIGHEIFHLIISDTYIIYRSAEIYYIIDETSAKKLDEFFYENYNTTT